MDWETPDFEPRAKRPTKSKSSSAPALRSATAYYGRLARPGYIAAVHSGKPEAMFKIANANVRGTKVIGLLQYIARSGNVANKKEENLELETQNGESIKGKEEIRELYEQWKDRFERGKIGSERKPRHVLHLVFSAKAGMTKENIRKVLNAARETAKKEFAGYDYALGLHQDAKHPHVHLVLCCKSSNPDIPKIRINKPDLLRIRTLWAKNLSREGLSHVATMRIDRPQTLKKIVEGVEPLHNNKTWFQATLKDVKDGVELLEKRRIQFESTKDISNTGREIYAEIRRLKEAIKYKTNKGDKERLDSFAYLRRFERDFKKQYINRTELDRVYKQLGENSKVVKDIIDAIKINAPKNKKEKKSYIVEAKKQVTYAAKEIEKSNMPEAKLNLAKKALALHEAEINRVLGLKGKETGQSVGTRRAWLKERAQDKSQGRGR